MEGGIGKGGGEREEGGGLFVGVTSGCLLLYPGGMYASQSPV